MGAPIQTRVFVVYLCGPSPEGKFYVGQTSDWERRSQAHALAAGACPNFHRAIRQFGWAGFPARFLAETDSADEADQLERRYITEFNALYPHGYNMTTGGRGTLFDPSVKPDPSFTESPVTDEEMATEGRWRLAHPVTKRNRPYPADQPEACPCCGEDSDCGFDKIRGQIGCGVSALFGASVLAHVLAGGAPADYELGDDPALGKSLQESVDASWLTKIAMVMTDVRKPCEALPVVAIQYAERLTPWIRRSLRRSVLAKKSLPSGSQGKLQIVSGSKVDANVFLSVAKAFRRMRRNLGTTLVSRVNVFHRLLDSYGTNQTRTEIALRLLTIRGASSEELKEAVEDAVLLGELTAAEAKEFDALKFAFPSPVDRDREYGHRLLAGNLRNWSDLDGAPAIIIMGDEPGLRVIGLPSLAVRRKYVRSLLAVDPKGRLAAVRAATANADLVVRDVAVIAPTAPIDSTT